MKTHYELEVEIYWIRALLLALTQCIMRDSNQPTIDKIDATTFELYQQVTADHLRNAERGTASVTG